jgi:hypothetical protein
LLAPFPQLRVPAIADVLRFTEKINRYRVAPKLQSVVRVTQPAKQGLTRLRDANFGSNLVETCCVRRSLPSVVWTFRRSYLLRSAKLALVVLLKISSVNRLDTTFVTPE